tara:strand:+ start:171 stop:362 length:192 start_codon:yes stop_codon:yes gene_type:complete
MFLVLAVCFPLCLLLRSYRINLSAFNLFLYDKMARGVSKLEKFAVSFYKNGGWIDDVCFTPFL